MEIEFLWKWAGSQVQNCPALYRTADGAGYVVQGPEVDATTRAQLSQLGDGDTAVLVPRDVIDRIKELVLVDTAHRHHRAAGVSAAGPETSTGTPATATDIELLWTWTEPQEQSYPALYRTADGAGYVVQGAEVDEATRAQLRQLGDEETAVFIPWDVIERIKELS